MSCIHTATLFGMIKDLYRKPSMNEIGKVIDVMKAAGMSEEECEDRLSMKVESWNYAHIRFLIVGILPGLLFGEEVN